MKLLRTPASALPKDISLAIRRNSVLLSVGQAAQSIAFQINSLIGSLAVLGLSGNVALAGFAYSMTWTGRLLTSYVSGWLMDSVGRKRVLTLGGILAAISMVLASWFYLSRNVTGLLATFLLFGIGNSIVGQNRVAITDMYDNSQRGTAVGYLYTASIIGSLVTVPTVAVVEPFSKSLGVNVYSVLWIVGAFTLACVAATAVLLAPDTKEIAKYLNKNNPSEKNQRDSVSIPLKSGAIITSFVVSALVWGIMIAMMSLLSLDMNENSIPLTFITLTITIHVLGMYVFSIPFGKMVDKFGSKTFMVLGSFVAGLGGLLTPLTTNYYVMTLGIFLVGLGWCATNISTTTLIANATEVYLRGRVLGLNDMVTAITSTVAPFVGGLVIESEGFFGFGVYGFMLSIPAILLAAVMKSQMRTIPKIL